MYIGGLLRAIRMINDAKRAQVLSNNLVLDLHPDRPDYRGLAIGHKIISLQADPSFDELEAAGGTVDKQDNTHTVLDDFFLVSGEIPRRTSYEHGLKHAMRFDHEENDWFSDEVIADERFLMCNLKGLSFCHFLVCVGSDSYQTKESSFLQVAAMQAWSTQRNTQSTFYRIPSPSMLLSGGSISLRASTSRWKALLRI